MKPATAPADRTIALDRADGGAWNERAGRLFREFERPGKAMVRRAFGSALSADEIDDVYAGAWVATLRALADRHSEMPDDEVRSYVFTAVANQAGRELRRRKRKPTAPLELVGSLPDNASDSPEERASDAEQSRVTRDLLSSLPPRRRAVMLLRYGWGLEPRQVCALVKGLSPRAYRKEITKGVDELCSKMRAFERGEWCAEREPILKVYAAGLADGDQTRQAKAHLAHCRGCTDFVAKLSGHLHDLGGAAAIPGAIEGLDGHLGIADRLLEVADRLKHAAGSLVGRGGSEAGDTASQLAASGGAKGAGAAGAGVFAQLATLGAAGKVAVACLGGGIAATACVAAGVSPLGLGGSSDDHRRAPPRHEPAIEQKVKSEVVAEPKPAGSLPTQVGHEYTPPTASPTPAPQHTQQAQPPAREDDAEQVDVAAAPSPVAEATPAPEQEFGAPAAAAPVTPTAPSGGSSSGGSSDGGGSATQQEFGL
jgi:RNA polymerase sigma factor (sigma-70 family)